MAVIDGTRLAGNASRESHAWVCGDRAGSPRRGPRRQARPRTSSYGEERGDQLPEQLRAGEGRAEFFGRRREGERAGEAGDAQPRESEPKPAPGEGVAFEFDAERMVARTQGRDGWTQEARRQLERRRWKKTDPVPRSREITCGSRASGWSATPSSRLIGPMRLTGRVVATRRAGGSVADPTAGRAGHARGGGEPERPR